MSLVQPQFAKAANALLHVSIKQECDVSNSLLVVHVQ